METIDVLEYIETRRKNSESFNKSFQEETAKLATAKALVDLRINNKLTQKELADIVGKPQSMIARIENGSVNVTFKTLNTFGEALGKELKVEFI